MRRSSRLVVLGLALLSAGGCGLLGDGYEPVDVVGLHLYGSPEELPASISMEVPPLLGGRGEIVRRFSFLDSKAIVRGEVIPPAPGSGGRCGLRLHPAPHQRLEVRRVSWEFPGRPFAVFVDGFYAGSSRFPGRIGEDGAIELAPLWSRAEAERIAGHIERNYRHYHPYRQ